MNGLNAIDASNGECKSCGIDNAGITFLNDFALIEYLFVLLSLLGFLLNLGLMSLNCLTFGSVK